MKYVLAANHRLFKDFVETFGDNKVQEYRFLNSYESYRGIDRNKSLIILYENYTDNRLWENPDFVHFINDCTNVYRLARRYSIF